MLTELLRGQSMLDFVEVGESPVQVSLSQFTGIEINDFAVQVAKTALWIAELQANITSEDIVRRELATLPLADAATIVRGNALQTDWEEILPASTCDFVIGNPPFIGYSNHSSEQKKDCAVLFGKSGGVLDYVAGWYKKFADYAKNNQKVRCALVSTNSICQGQQVTPLWKPILEDGYAIDFAHRSFIWSNDANDPAHVHVVIVGLSHKSNKHPKTLFSYDRRGKLVETTHPKHINAYLVDAPDAYIERRGQPLCDVPPVKAGGKPTEGGFLLFRQGEADDLVSQQPDAKNWIRPFSMGAEFINGKKRYCLRLVDCPPSTIKKMPLSVRCGISAYCLRKLRPETKLTLPGFSVKFAIPALPTSESRR